VNKALDSARSTKELMEDLLRLRLKTKALENELQVCRLFKIATEHSQVAIIITNRHGIIEYVNPKFCEHTGYKKDEVLGQNCRIFKSGHHSPEFYKNLWETILAGKIWKGQLYNKKKNGELFWEDARISPITDSRGRITHFVAIKEDITLRRQHEVILNRYKHIVMSSSDMLALINKDFSYLSVNSSFAKAFKKSIVEILGSSPRELFGEAFFNKFLYPNAQKALSGEKVTFSTWVNFPLLGKRFMEINFMPYIGIDNIVRGFVSNWRDITLRKKVTEELKESEHRYKTLASHILRSQEGERSRLSTELHDGLGQELSFLKIQLSRTRKVAQDNFEEFEKRFNEARSLLDQIIEDTRLLARGLCPSILNDFGLYAALCRLFEDFTNYFEAATTLQIDDIDNAFNEEKRINFYRIIQEILSNIMKHSSAKKVKVVIKDLHNFVYCLIVDNGVGFDADKKLTEFTGGTGMGMITLRERLRMMNAKFDICSRKGEGTKICFLVPKDREDCA